MSSDIIQKNERRINAKNNRRKKKKRRTEDFSSDSESSSSSSSSGSDSDTEEQKPQSTVQQENAIDDDIQIDDDIDLEEPQLAKGLAPEPLNADQISQVQQIKLTLTKLSEVSANKVSSGDLEQIQSTLKKDREQLNQSFLRLMAGQYANDMDALRKRPDFTDKSLVLLAKTLQSGTNMFDEETLRTVLDN